MVERKRPAQKAETVSEKSEKSEFSSTLSEIRGRYGDSVVDDAYESCNVIPTGVFVLDLALMGGIPEGRITQLFGWESSGKTTMAMRIIAQAQKKYPTGEFIFVDVEGTFDAVWAAKNGMDMERVTILRPTTGEEAGDIIHALLSTKEVALIILDSIPALMPSKAMSNSMEDNEVALQARLVGRIVSKAKTTIRDEARRGHAVSLVLINQYRNKIALMGDPRVIVGGNSLKYFVDVGIEMKNKEAVGAGGAMAVVEHNDHSFVLKKSKTADGIREGEFRLIRNPDSPLGVGFVDDAPTLLTYAKKMGFIKGSGAGGYYMEGVEQKFRVLDDMIAFLNQNRPQYTALKQAVLRSHRAKYGYTEVPPDGYME